MRILMAAIIIVMSLSSCASVSYEGPDGTKVSYFRLFTSADSIKANVGGANVEANKQKIDLETLQAILGMVGK